MKYLTEKIKELMDSFNHLYYNYRMITDLGTPDPSKVSDSELKEFEIDIAEREERLSYMADRLLALVKAYIEGKKLPNFYNDFILDIEQLNGKYLKGDEEMGSCLTDICMKYLKAFDDFGNKFYYEHHEKFEVLEHILNNTAVFLANMAIQPKKETDVYTPIKYICNSAFPDSINPKFSFQKKAKCYQPDILIPSLKCAIEYKYTKNESELNDTMDQILADEKGYSENPTYNTFYAVFYATELFCSKDRFEELWKEKKFPDNWKGIYVQAR